MNGLQIKYKIDEPQTILKKLQMFYLHTSNEPKTCTHKNANNWMIICFCYSSIRLYTRRMALPLNKRTNSTRNASESLRIVHSIYSVRIYASCKREKWFLQMLWGIRTAWISLSQRTWVNLLFVKGRLMKYQFPSDRPETIANVECAMTIIKLKWQNDRLWQWCFSTFTRTPEKWIFPKSNIDNLCPEGRTASEYGMVHNVNTLHRVSMAIKVPILFHKFNHPRQ